MGYQHFANTVIRPVKIEDLPAIYEISGHVGPDISLPHDKKIIEHKINCSIESFALTNKPEDRLFFFVLETLSDRQILGTAMLEAKVAREIPLYNFTLIPSQQFKQGFKTKIRQLLVWSLQYQEASLLCTLFLSPKSRGLGLGRFISRSRCLFIAEFPHFFSDLIIANMRGVFIAADHSPFWEAIGRRLFQKKITSAYFSYSTGHTKFIEKRAPTHPIYFDLLPKKVQNVIGKTHQETLPALHLLEKEGFVFRNVIDIFDGGPIIETPKLALKAVRESRLAIIEDTNLRENIEQYYIISNASLDYRVVLGPLKILPSGAVALTSENAKALNVSLNDRVRFYEV